MCKFINIKDILYDYNLKSLENKSLMKKDQEIIELKIK